MSNSLVASEQYEVIVIGGGPAGLNTSIMCATRHLKILLLEGNKTGGLLSTLYPNKIIPNYPGFPRGIVAIELVRNWLQHLRFTGVAVKRETVLNTTPDLTVTTGNNKYKSKVVVIATGTQPRRLGVPGELRFSRGDRGVYYFASHPENFVGKKVLVVGGGDTAVDAALEVLSLADEISLVHRRETFRAFDENVEKVRKSGIVDFILKGEVIAIKGRDRVETVLIRQGQKTFGKSVDAVIIAVGLVPNAEAFRDLGLETDEHGFMYTDRAQRTNVKGFFAVGDITSVGLRLITVAASQGAIASHHIYSYIKNPYWARETWPSKIG